MNVPEGALANGRNVVEVFEVTDGAELRRSLARNHNSVTSLYLGPW